MTSDVLGPYAAVEWCFTVSADSPHVQDALCGVLDGLSAGASGAEHEYALISPAPGRPGRLLLDGELLQESPDLPLLYATLLWHVNRGVELASTRHVLLHASAVERDGAAVLLAAPMDSGKSTLAAGLVQAGLRYLTDETVALRPADGGITPYPKALSLDPGSWPVLPHLREHVPPAALALSAEQWQVPVARWRDGGVSTGGRPAVVVLPRFVADADTVLLPAPRSEVLVELMHQRFAPDRDAGRDFRVLAQAVRDSDCYRLTTGRLDDAVGLVLDALDRTGR